MTTIRILLAMLWVPVVLVAPLFAQAPAGQPETPEFIKQGQQLLREGKLDEALTLYRRTIQATPKSVAANVAAGSVLDLLGRGPEARKYFQNAIAAADTQEAKATAQRAMAMSYAFEGNCAQTLVYQQQVLDYAASMKDFFGQGGIANEAARACLDSGNLQAAYQWYEMGHDLGLKEPGIQPARVDLWNFRWEHAQARIAARRGQPADAQRHLAAANAIFNQGGNPDQAPFVPYLAGYIAFYAGDWKTALSEFTKANPNDPFIQCMIGQTFEKLGESDKARDVYRKAAAATAHNPAAAYAVPFSNRRLAALAK